MKFKYAFLVFILALTCRLLFFLLLSERIHYGYQLDSQYYLTCAEKLYRDGKIVSYSAAPLYTFFIAGVYRIFGENKKYVIIIQILLLAIASGVIFELAHKLFGIKTGIVAAILYSIDPFFVYFCSFIMSENIAILLIILFFFFLIQTWTNEKWWGYILTGFVFGLGMLCRGVMGAYIPFLILSGYIIQKYRGIMKVCYILLFAILTILPWEIHLYKTFNKFIFIQVKKGAQLYQSLLPYGLGYEEMIKWHSEVGKIGEEDRKILDTGNELLIDDHYWQKSINWIKSNKSLFLIRGVEKLIDYWRPYLNHPPYPVVPSIIAGIYNSILYLFTVFCLIKYKLNMKFFFIAFIISAMLPFFAFFPQIRYRLLIHPILILLASNGFLNLFREFKK